MNFMQLRERQPKFPVTVKTGEGVVELIWNKIEYADGYRVFASPVGKNHFVGVINVKGTTAVMKKRANGVPMQYKVCLLYTSVLCYSECDNDKRSDAYDAISQYPARVR